MENTKENSELNSEQKEVVEFYGNNLLVSAGAGSGKTRVVISKLLDIIKNQRVSVSELLVTTFTKTAGNQIIAKLAKGISDKILVSEGEEQIFLMEQLELLPQASIGTLHTFCEKIIKKYFYAINIEPTFKIIEERDSNFFKNQILDDLFEDYTENNDEDFLKVIEIFKDNRSLVNFKVKLNDLLSFIKSKDGYVEFLKTSSEKLYFDNSKVERLLNDYLLNRKNLIVKYYTEFLKDSHYIESPKYIEYLSGIIEAFNQLNSQNAFIENYKIFSQIKIPSLLRVTKKSTEAEIDLHDTIKAFNEGIRTKLLTLNEFKNIKNIDELSWFSNRTIIDKIIEILQNFNDRYATLKLEKNFLDFNDLEGYALKILDNEELRKTIQNKYKYIFVDEYQDTNEIQESILTKISDGKNMIMVGDVKQSIYGFRNTSPEIFLSKYDKFNNSTTGVVKNLNMNYRSQKTVLDYCNYLFGKIMTVGTCNIDYKNRQSFKVGNNNGNDTSNVEFHILDKEENENLPQKLPIYDINLLKEEERDYELDLLVKVIKDTLEKQIYDSEEKCYRKCQEKDICILCRTSAIINSVSKKLTEVKIPFTTTYNVKLYTEQEINLILSFLQVIQNDYDDIALVTCLSSFYYSLQSEDFVKIKKEFSEEKQFFMAIKNYSLIENELGQRIKVFYEDIEEFRNILHTVSLRELVEKIYEKYNIIPYYSLKKDGDLRVKNLYTYLTTLNNGFYTQNLTAYLNYINGFAVNDKFDITVNGGENSIKIQTIHASKGLEYNVVILYKPQRQYLNEAGKGILKDKDLGLALEETDLEDNSFKETLSHIAFKIKAKEQNSKEEMRLLYVALTRAKNKLLVIGKADIKKLKTFENDFEILNADSYLKLMLNVLSDNQILSLKDGKTVVKFEDSKFEFYRYLPDELQVFDGQEDDDKFNLQLNKNRFSVIKNFEYQDLEAVNTRLKNTVTALQEENDEFVFDFSKQNYDEESNEITPLEKGNSYHSIMKESNLDIGNLEKLRAMPEFKNVNEQEIITAISIMSEKAKNRKILAEKMFLMNIEKNLVKASLTSEKILIQGVVDLILEGENDLILVDYKTTKGSEQMLKNKYKTQLDLYATALENYYQKPVLKKYIYSFFKNKLIEI